jgi:hypothetical protein
MMLGHPKSTALETVGSDKSMELLTQLHNRRLGVPEETVTVPLDEAAEGLVKLEDPHGQVPDGQIEIVSAVLEEEWLPRMCELRMIGYNAVEQTITATPATSLQWLVVRPDRPGRDNEKVASAAAWTAARIEEWDPKSLATINNDTQVAKDE